MKKYKCFYQIWLGLLVIMALYYKARGYSGVTYFIINMVVAGLLNMAAIKRLLKCIKENDESNYERLKNILMTRTDWANFRSEVECVNDEIEIYKSLTPYSIADIGIVLVAELLINLL